MACDSRRSSRRITAVTGSDDVVREVVAASAAVGATRSRTAKAATLAALLRAAAPGEVEPATAWLAGEARQGRIGTGWRTLSGIDAPPAADPTLTVAAVDATLDALAATAGAGSTRRRAELLHDLFGAATRDEQRFLTALLGGELRHGALEGVMLEAIAAAARRPRRASCAARSCSPGSLPGDRPPRPRRRRARARGRHACRSDGRSGRCSPPPATRSTPRWPASARTSPSSTSSTAPASRSTATATTSGSGRAPCARSPASVPELVAQARALPGRAFVLDGETLALDDDGRPRAFQDTMSRFGSDGNAADAALAVLLRPPAPRRHRPHRRTPRHPARRAGRAACRPPAAAHAGRAPPDTRAGRHRARRRAGRRARGRGRQGARRPLRGGAARQGVAEGEAGAHARPRRPRRGVGLRAAHRVAVQHPPRRPRPRRR